mmetsp:Transcript_31708/g.56935  ORF Transcript_31708/g.56935 Transcript_31708/m.56935 type:complete len:80 (+) Transcript_31708:449-688(+)
MDSQLGAWNNAHIEIMFEPSIDLAHCQKFIWITDQQPNQNLWVDTIIVDWKVKQYQSTYIALLPFLGYIHDSHHSDTVW